MIVTIKKTPQKPPSIPPSLPVHRFYHRLSKKHDSIFSLYLGSQLSVMVSSSVVAEECFTKNDIVLASCSKLITGKYFSCNYTTVSTSSYCCHWRNLHRHHRNFLLESSQRFHHHSKRGGTGKRYYVDKVRGEDEAREFREVITETFRNAGMTNRADFLLVLNWLGGYKKKEKKLDGLLQKLVDERRWMKLKNNNNGSVVDHLLNLQQSDPHYYTGESLKSSCWSVEIFFFLFKFRCFQE
ncbi:hypothetical protein V6Z11_A07G090400, partial [Gossypium hirsutum]|uniref:Uncharacterized protein n=1 Tax=Gossypium barbadense TaxID=3634 RepID=A0A2P5YBB1_GOSBA|nr:hypothetical protein GOBAR_AA07774 [Gossypium barbadense]